MNRPIILESYKKTLDSYQIRLIDVIIKNENNKEYYLKLLKTLKIEDNFNLFKNNYLSNLLNLIEQNVFNESDKIKIFYKIFSSFCNGNLNINRKQYYKIIKMYIDILLKRNNLNNIEIEEINLKKYDNVLLYSKPKKSKIYINKNTKIDLKEDRLKTIIAINHEIEHLIQYESYKNPQKYNLIGLLCAKERIICKYMNNQYIIDNYLNFIYEVEANYKSYLNIEKELGVSTKKIDENQKYYQNKLYDLNRKVGFKYINLNNLFELIVSRNTNMYSIMKEYPIIGLEYKIKWGKLEKKSKEELKNEYQENNNYEEIYEYLIKELNLTKIKKMIK